MENKKQKINWRLLVAVAKGEAKPADIAQFNNWMNESPEENKLIFEEIKKDFGSGCADNDDQIDDSFTDTAMAFSSLGVQESPAEIQEEETTPVRKPRTIVLPFRFLRIASIAACVALLSGIGIWMFQPGTLFEQVAGTAEKDLDWQEVTVALGRQVNLSLNDGSVIRLGPGSKFRYPVSFGASERRVYLEGEAFFDISKDASKPFIVQTATLETRVLGTSFNIEAFSAQTTSKVTVVSGKVAVSKNSKGDQPKLLAYLTPNEQIEFNQTDDSFNVIRVSENIAHAVKDGKLVFDGNTMEEVGQALKSRYGLEVHFEDKKMAAMRLTTILDYMSIDNLTDMLSLATGLKVTHQNEQLYFSRK